ncbi:zf-CCHC domain-containing protein [Tanacetum coccineum]
MEDINNFQQEPDETLYQAWERFKELLKKCPQHYLTEMQEVILFYNGLEVTTRQILDSKEHLGQEVLKLLMDWLPSKHNLIILEEKSRRLMKSGQYRASALGFYQRNNANPSYQEQRQSMEESLSKFINESAKRHEENSNLIKKIRASTNAAIRNQGALIKALEIQIRKISKVLQERGSGSLPSSTKMNSRDHVNSISTTIETDTTLIRRIGSTQYAVSVQQNRQRE